KTVYVYQDREIDLAQRELRPRGASGLQWFAEQIVASVRQIFLPSFLWKLCLEAAMTLSSHGERKYRTTRLLGKLESPNLHIEHRRLEAGHLEAVIFESNEFVTVLSGRTFTSRTGNGTLQRAFIQPGASCIDPAGTYESASSITSSIECLHAYLPPTLIERSA